MQEYYKDPESTGLAKRNGWFHTGDLGRFDPQGFLYIVGRKKEMIKVAGQIVYAPEVESALCKHDGILEAAVIGTSDALKGEALKAFIVLKAGVALTPQDVRHFAREHLANFKVPQTVRRSYVHLRKRKNEPGRAFGRQGPDGDGAVIAGGFRQIRHCAGSPRAHGKCHEKIEKSRQEIRVHGIHHVHGDL
ncbi:MAG: AMP-binding protein [Candidatus Omnitrophica bacterium]|nr:AMP-binding protein [Candidatus Omnitrophota bacterium]